MPDFDFEVLLTAAATAKDKEVFIKDWCDAHLWGNKPKPELVKNLIADYLDKLWEAAHMSVKTMYEKSGLTQAEMARYLNIPLRRIEDWCSEGHTPPVHVRLMMVRLLHLVPPFRKVEYAVRGLMADEKIAISAVQYQTRKKGVDFMDQIIAVKSATHMEVIVCIPDLLSAGVEIDTDVITSSGLDINTMPPLYIMAKSDEGESIGFYYSFEGYDVLYHAFGIDPAQSELSMEEIFVSMVPAIIDHVDWEELAATL